MYTPKGKRIFTKANTVEELVSSETGKTYQGDYEYNAQTGKYADLTGTISLELVGQDSAISEDEVNLLPTKYDIVRKDRTGYDLRATLNIPEYTPVPSEEDYSKTVFTRFFAQHRQSNEVIEVSSKTYNLLSARSSKYHYPSYLIGYTVWFLRGPVANQDINGYIVQGAGEKNDAAIAELEKVLPNIRTYLTDPTQFVE